MVDTPDLLKKRSRDLFQGTYHSRTDSLALNAYGVPSRVVGATNRYPVSTRQITASEGHRWNESSRFSGDDVGGPFETTKRYLALDKWGDKPLSFDDFPVYNIVAEITPPTPYPRYVYHGHLLPTSINANSWPLPAPSSNQLLMALGATAIARVKPTNSIADLSVSLAELYREGLPKSPGRSQWEERAKIARGAGSEFLNAQFGWLPLIGEIQNVAEVIDNGDKIWNQYQRDSGRLVRRSYEFEDVISNPSIVSQGTGRYPFPSPNTYFYPIGGAGGTYTLTRYKRQKRKFAGAFTYYLPNKDESSAVSNMSYAAAKARKLYGLTLDPEVLWNLMPWSWAADWFANTGDVLSNLSDFATDGLLLRYGYMMEETIVSDEHHLTGLKWRSPAFGPETVKLYCVTKTKKRIRATPYGFGLTWEGFSLRQLAILAALGITRR